MTARLTVVADEVDTPYLHSTFVVKIPRDWPHARGLLDHPRANAYRMAMSCLFLTSGDVDRQWEDRTTTPQVTVENSSISVTDDVDVFVSSTGTAVGPWLARLQPHVWRLELAAPAALREATWEQVDVDVPAGWLGLQRMLPTEATANTLTWKNVSARSRGPVVQIHPDWQAAAVRELSVEPGIAWGTVGAELSHVVVLTWALIVVRRAGKRSRWHADYPARTADVYGTAYLRVTTRRATALIAVQLAIVTAIIVDATTYDMWRRGPFLGFQPTMDGWNSAYWLIDMLVWGTAMGATAWTCGLRTSRLLTVAILGCVVGSFEPLVGVNRQTAYITAYLVMLVIGMAALNGFRVSLRHRFDRRKGRTPLWVWLGGIAFATSSFALFFNFHANRVPLWEWLATNVRPFERITGNLVWYPWVYAGLVTELIIPVIVLAVIAQLHARTAIGGPQPAGRDMSLVVWIFAVTTINWYDYVAGTWLPITIVLAGSTLWIALAVSRRWVPLFQPALRAALARVQGSGFQAYTRLVEQARDSVNSPEDVRDSVQVDPEAAPDGESCVQLAFAFGPYGDPWRTARFATLVAAAFAVIPTAWFMWTEFGNSYWTYAGGQEFGGTQIPTKLLGEVAFWLVPGFLVGLLWQHLPGRAGAIKVLPIAASYVASAMGHLLLSRLFGQDPVGWAVQRSLMVWGVLSMTAIVIDFRTLRLLKRKPSSVRYDLATVYGIAGWPARLSGLLPQIMAVVLMVYVVMQPDAGLVQSDPLQVFKRG